VRIRIGMERPGRGASSTIRIGSSRLLSIRFQPRCRKWIGSVGTRESLRAKQIAEIEDLVKVGSGVTGCSPPIVEAFRSLVASLADRKKGEKERLEAGNAIRSARGCDNLSGGHARILRTVSA